MSISPNQTVYYGMSVEVTVSAKTTQPIIKLYVDGCGYDCSYLPPNPDDSIYSIECSINDIKQTTEVQFVSIDSDGLVCSNKSWINVLGT